MALRLTVENLSVKTHQTASLVSLYTFIVYDLQFSYLLILVISICVPDFGPRTDLRTLVLSPKLFSRYPSVESFILKLYVTTADRNLRMGLVETIL